MEAVLLGNHRYSLDEKRRVRVPAKYLQVLGNSFYSVPGRNGSFFLIPEDQFKVKFANYINIDPYTSEKNDFASAIFSLSNKEEVDAQGRLSLTKDVIDFYGIKKDLVFAGRVDFVEVWPAEVWDDNHSLLNPEVLEKMIADLKNIGA